MKCDICGKESKDWHYVVCEACKNEFDCVKQELGDMDTEYEIVVDEYIKKDKQLAIYKRALELACEKYINVDGISYVIRNDSKDDEDYFNKSDEQIQKETIDYFISQAKKELEEEKW